MKPTMKVKAGFLKKKKDEVSPGEFLKLVAKQYGKPLKKSDENYAKYWFGSATGLGVRRYQGKEGVKELARSVAKELKQAKKLSKKWGNR